MKKIRWQDILGWSDAQVQDLRCTGYSYITQGKYETAKLFFEALVILKNDPYDSRTLGALFLELNKPKYALFYFNKALSHNPHHLPTLLNRAKALLADGKIEKGTKIARYLSKAAKEKEISQDAKALLMAYS